MFQFGPAGLSPWQYLPLTSKGLARTDSSSGIKCCPAAGRQGKVAQGKASQGNSPRAAHSPRGSPLTQVGHGARCRDMHALLCMLLHGALYGVMQALYHSMHSAAHGISLITPLTHACIVCRRHEAGGWAGVTTDHPASQDQADLAGCKILACRGR